jgi:hypothetical protein
MTLKQKKMAPALAITSISAIMLSLASPAVFASGLSSATGVNIGTIAADIEAALSGEINAFAAQIQELSLAAQTSENNYRYQNDPQLQTIANNMFGASSAIQVASGTATDMSNDYIKNALLPMSYATMETSTTDGVAVTDPSAASNADDQLQQLNNSVKDHTWGIVASDTLFANFSFQNNPISQYTINGDKVDPVFYREPETKHDNYLDFANFFEPTSLNYNDTDGGLDSAQQYLSFVTDDYQPMYSQLIDLNALNKAISDANTADPIGNKAATIIRTLTMSKNFQKIQQTVRASTAQSSVGVFTLKKIQAERQAIVSKDTIPELNTIASNMNIEVTKDSNGNYVYPSKAQIDYYQTHHDLNSESWYQNLQTLSGPNVQRETLITLKQIQQSLAQQHTDNENVESLLAVLNIQIGKAASATSLTQETQAIDKWVSGLGGSDIGSPDDSSTTG